MLYAWFCNGLWCWTEQYLVLCISCCHKCVIEGFPVSVFMFFHCLMLIKVHNQLSYHNSFKDSKIVEPTGNYILTMLVFLCNWAHTVCKWPTWTNYYLLALWDKLSSVFLWGHRTKQTSLWIKHAAVAFSVMTANKKLGWLICLINI